MPTDADVSSVITVVVPLYGTQILIEEKKRFQKRLDIQELTEEIIQSREEIRSRSKR